MTKHIMKIISKNNKKVEIIKSKNDPVKDVISEPTPVFLVKAIEKEKLKRVLVECNGKIKNMMLHDWWIVKKEHIGKEYPSDILERINKGELIVMEKKNAI
jgi:hypothetical protein